MVCPKIGGLLRLEQKLPIIQHWDVLQVPRDSESSAGWGPQGALVSGWLDLLWLGESKNVEKMFSKFLEKCELRKNWPWACLMAQNSAAGRMSCRWVWVSNRSWSISSHDFNGHQLLWSCWTKLRELRHPGHKRGKCYTERNQKVKDIKFIAWENQNSPPISITSIEISHPYPSFLVGDVNHLPWSQHFSQLWPEIPVPSQ